MVYYIYCDTISRISLWSSEELVSSANFSRFFFNFSECQVLFQMAILLPLSSSRGIITSGLCRPCRRNYQGGGLELQIDPKKIINLTVVFEWNRTFQRREKFTKSELFKGLRSSEYRDHLRLESSTCPESRKLRDLSTTFALPGCSLMPEWMQMNLVRSKL